MNEKTVSADILEKYPPIDEKKIDALLAKEIEESPAKIIVLDDDPTGVQTVHDISVYTDWDADSIRQDAPGLLKQGFSAMSLARSVQAPLRDPVTTLLSIASGRATTARVEHL